MKTIAVIGGGAAGFFAAINIAERKPNYRITIYEGSSKLMSKILISGGGRCNVTNAEKDLNNLLQHYPRGNKELRTVFREFNCQSTYQWFENKGVPLKTEDDGRVFPQSNSSASIYNCLLNEAKSKKIAIKTKCRLSAIKRLNNSWVLTLGEEEVLTDVVVMATGGSTLVWNLLMELGLTIVRPAPSLFTFNLKPSALAGLSGLSVPNAKIKSTKSSSQIGALLITHKGISGPAVLKYSAWEAYELESLKYKTKLYICWNANMDAEYFKLCCAQYMNSIPKERVRSWKDHGLPKRLFQFLCDEARIGEFTNWSEIGKKGIMRLHNVLFEYEVFMEGKSTNKEEFVTAGGVALNEIVLNSMEAKEHPGMYFAGEVLNIDAITGGFNFQAAWSTAYTVSRSV